MDGYCQNRIYKGNMRHKQRKIEINKYKETKKSREAKRKLQEHIEAFTVPTPDNPSMPRKQATKDLERVDRIEAFLQKKFG